MFSAFLVSAKMPQVFTETRSGGFTATEVDKTAMSVV
jgi:hypothetical protein